MIFANPKFNRLFYKGNVKSQKWFRWIIMYFKDAEGQEQVLELLRGDDKKPSSLSKN